MKNIMNDIKNGTFKTSYLLYGTEDYLKKQYKDNLIKALVSDGDSMNFNSYQGSSTDILPIIDIAETLPFFADKRVIVIEDSGFFKNASDELADYIPTIPESTCMIFVESEVDKKRRAYKAVEKNGYACEFVSPTPEMIANWAARKVGESGKKITNGTMQLFLGMTGMDMNTVSTELEKLICYCLDKEIIESSDVMDIVSGQINAKIFDLTEAIAFNNQKKAMEIYYDLIATKESPIFILFMVNRQFRLMWEAKDLLSSGSSERDISAKLRMPGFAAGKLVKQCKNYTFNELTAIIDEGIELDYKFKNGLINENMAAEMFIIKHSSKKN